MKKIFTLAVLFAVVFGAQGQTTFYTANFSLGLGSWTTVDNTATTAGVWQYAHNPISLQSTGGSATFASASATNGFMLFMSDAATNDGKPEDADLKSPAIDCSAQSFVLLEFDQYFQQYNSSSGTVSVSTDGSSWAQVYYIDASTDNPGHVVVNLTAYAANQATVYLKFNYQGNWDYFWAVDDIQLKVPVALDVSVDKVNMEKYVRLGNQTVSGVLTNRGGTTITSFDLAYTDNGGTPVSQYFSPVNIDPLQLYPFTFTTPIDMSTAITHNIVVTASSPNNGTDMVSTNNSKTQKVNALSAMPKKNALIEEFTTAVCQYCPRGTSTMRQILDTHADVIGVALHAGFSTDAMTTADHSTIAAAYANGAPTACIDRVLFPDESKVAVSTPVWETYAVERTSVVTPVSIIADNTYDFGTRLLTVNASARFYGAITDNFRINCYIIEDSVTGTGSGYNQINAYNTSTSSEWYQKGNPIIGFQHRDVCRYMCGGSWGTLGSVSATTTDGGLYTKQYTYTLPSSWNDARVKLVVLAQHYGTLTTDREILNAIELELNSADSTTLNTGSAILEASKEVNSLSLYPNPASEVVNLNYSLNESAAISFEVFDVIGRKVESRPSAELAKGNYRTQINTSEFKNGVYFVSMKNGNKVIQTLKFIINK